MGSFHFLLLFISLSYVECTKHEGYTINPVNGRGYKIMYEAKQWTGAKDSCARYGAKLAVPKSEEEFKFMQKLVRTMHYPSIVGSQYKLLVWLGINNLEDYTKWINIDGENIQNTGFHKWAGLYNGQTLSNDPAEPHCAGMDAANYGLRSYWCHRKQPYICEMNTSA